MPATTDPITPADIEWREGRPWSRAFGDFYVGETGAGPQARHVFLGGNGLPGRWRGRERFTVLEAGFGLGSNFLATWQAWRDDAERCDRLFYLAIEQHPPSADDLIRLHGGGEFGESVRALAQQWPPCVAGLHRLEFDSARVIVLLAFGAVDAMLRQLSAEVDAFYLDGFAPDRNPAMWTQGVARSMRRLASRDATFASWTVSRAVRDAWSDAGFVVERRAGLPPKRDMTAGVLDVRHANRHALERRAAATIAPGSTIVVIGAGVAGAAAAHALARRGFAVVVVDPLGVAGATSGNRLAAVQPMIARDENPSVRFTRTAYLSTLRRLAALDLADAGTAGLSGLLTLDDDEASRERQDLAVRLGLPPDYALAVDAAAASAHAGVRVARGGWWFAQGGWVSPRHYAERLLDCESIRVVRAAAVRIDDVAHGVSILLGDGQSLEASAVVFANAADAPGLAGLAAMQRLRGQVSEWPAGAITAPRVPVAGDGYVMPQVDGSIFVGATYEFEGDAVDATPTSEAHADNWARLARLLDIAPRAATPAELAVLAGRVGWRAINTDRLPSIGRVDAARRLVVAGLGSRGVTWAALAGEQVAALVAGDPEPLEQRLARATDPLRFARCASSP